MKETYDCAGGGGGGEEGLEAFPFSEEIDFLDVEGPRFWLR